MFEVFGCTVYSCVLMCGLIYYLASISFVCVFFFLIFSSILLCFIVSVLLCFCNILNSLLFSLLYFFYSLILVFIFTAPIFFLLFSLSLSRSLSLSLSLFPSHMHTRQFRVLSTTVYTSKRHKVRVC